ncbi:MAG: hypothetical protein AAGA85_02440 [Bacteroidota bacterium]
MRSLQCGLVFLFSLVVLSHWAYGQSNRSNDLLSIYDSILGISNLGLVNGVAHTRAFISRKTHPYYNSNAWEEGQVELVTGIFPNVRLKYDTFQEVLVLGITRVDGRLHAIQLQPHDVLGFSLGTAEFCRLKGQRIGNGFFQVLYPGDQIKFLSRRRKKDEIPTGSPTVEYVADHEYYFYREDQLYSFKNKSSLFELIPERRDDIKAFIKNQKLKIKAQERYISDVQQLIAFMDEL